MLDLSGGSFTIEECRVKYERGALLERYRELEIPAREVILRVFFGVGWVGRVTMWALCRKGDGFAALAMTGND